MMKVLQMLLKSPGGKKAAAALYRAMKKGKGLAQSTKQGIKRDLRPGYKELMGGRGRKPAGDVDVLKMYERIVKRGKPTYGTSNIVPNEREFIKGRISAIRNHPGTPKGVKVKDTVPGVRTYKDLRAIERTYPPNAMLSTKMDALSRSKYGKDIQALRLKKANARPPRGAWRGGEGRMKAGQRMARETTASKMTAPETMARYQEMAQKLSQRQMAQRAKRGPQKLKSRLKRSLRPAYNKIRNLRRRLKEKGLA